MAYQVIARRWRPKRFSEVVGQDHVTRTIKNALKQGRLVHAFLFTGPRGVGKTSTARILARAVNCPNIDLAGDAEPCNVCETCQALFEDREMDVIEMDAASYTSVEDIRRINESCRLAPAMGRSKIYIIDEVHMLSKHAFNAFLKTLEEPPEHVIFILATTDVHKLPPTVLSRVQRFDFRPLQPNDVVPHLTRICEVEGWPADVDALWLIARRAEGSLRDAEGLLDQVVSFAGDRVTLEVTREVLGVLPGDWLAQATRLISEHDSAGVPAYLEQLASRGADYGDLLRSLQNYWLDLAFLKQGLPVKGRPEEEIRLMESAGGTLAIEDLFRLIRLAEQLEDSIRWSTSPRVRFDIAFLRWVTMDRAVALRDILDRLGGSSPSDNRPSPAPATTTAAVSAPKATAASTATPTGGTVTLQDIQAAWPNIVAALRKRSKPAAALAESFWQPTALHGIKLTVGTTQGGKFTVDQMKDLLPHLADAIAEVTGTTFTVIAGVTQPDATPPAAAPTKPTGGKELEGDDLFSTIMNRFGGVEIDPKSAPEPR